MHHIVAMWSQERFSPAPVAAHYLLILQLSSYSKNDGSFIQEYNVSSFKIIIAIDYLMKYLK
jgi:hypothetical protein